MDSSMPDEFDLIVIGTGFPQSCIAAAASRIGKTVLHVDANNFYGGCWASFNLKSYIEFLSNTTGIEVKNSSYKWHVPAINEAEQQQLVATIDATATEEQPVNWTEAALWQQSRQFNIDLCPKLCYSAGAMVQLLISSNICRYAEFRAVDRVCMQYNNSIVSVPCSRSDVFVTKDLNLIEKRLLMKFLNSCKVYGEQKCEEDVELHRGKTFLEYMQTQSMTEKISNCIMQAIAMCTPETSLDEGMQRTKLFLQSIGRYGNTPFLYAMYGSGEIPQCFCRLCAVFGGIYCLQRPVSEVVYDVEQNALLVGIDGKRLKAKQVVCSHGSVPANVQVPPAQLHGLGSELLNHLSRAVFISSTPLGDAQLNAGGGGVNFLRLLHGNREAILIQLAYYSGTCTKGSYLFHLTTPALSEQPALDLQPFCAQVFTGASEAPKIIFESYFTITATKQTNAFAANASAAEADKAGIWCTAAPFYEFDYDKSIANACDIFHCMYGTQAEFLPRAPDPEEIIIGDEVPTSRLAEELLEQLRELEHVNLDEAQASKEAGYPDVGEAMAMDEE